MGASSSLPDFAPLNTALKQIETWLEVNEAPRILVAAHTLREFKQRNLAPPCKVTPRKLLGPRVPVRGRRHADQARLVLAHWPHDDQLEGAFPSLFCILSGQADIRLADYIVHCQTGDLVFIPAGIPKWGGSRPPLETITPEAHCDILMLSPGLVHGEGLECSISHTRGDMHRKGNESEGCWVRNFLLAQLFAGLDDELRDEGNSKSTHYLLTLLFVLLQREIQRGRALKGWQFPSGIPHSQDQNSTRQATEYIRNHLSRPLSIDLVAREVGSSRTAFTRRFRKETGQTFKDYLTQLRLKHAEVLLCEANLPVERVSSLVGLSPGQLRNLFHREYQCAPSEFRQLRKKGHI